MSDATLRESIKTLVSSVAGVGRVHDYERWTADSTQFLALFQDPATKKVFGWEITRNSIPQVERIGRKYKITSSYSIKGYYAVNDAAATEKTFQAIIDAIIAALLTGIPGTEGTPLPNVPVIDFRTFGSVLCHHAEIRIDNVAEVITPATGETITDLLTVGLNYYLQPDDAVSDAADVVDLPELPKG